MSPAPYIVGILCWLAFASLNNGFNKDWDALKCMHIGCTDAQVAWSWVWLGTAVIAGIAFPAIFMLVFATQNFGRFLLFLVVLVAVGAFMFIKATSAGDMSVFDPRILYLVGTFVVFMTGAIIVSIPNGRR